VLFAKDHAEERGLAVAVPAYEPNALTGIYGKADAVEERLLAVGFLYIRYLEHKYSFQTPPGRQVTQPRIIHHERLSGNGFLKVF
jgi:hypothetical protein